MIVSQPVVEAAPAIAAGPAPAAGAAALAAPAAAPVTQSQYHAQDELGQYNFGYADPNSARVETKTADGVVRGSYNYVDTNGQIQTVQYIADALGFRVAATNLPVAPQPVEVAAAEHLALYDQIKAERDQLAQEVVARNQGGNSTLLWW